MAGSNDDITNGTYVSPNTTAWGGNAGKSPMDLYKGPTTPDEYGIPTPTDPTAWKQAIEDARATTGQSQDVARYRAMADAASGRSAPTINYNDAYNSLDASGSALGEAAAARGYGMQARGDQLDALSLQRNAAYGNAPSQAQILGRNLIDQSLQAQLAGAASARGGAMAQAAAQRQAAQGAASMQQQGVNNLSALRAQEMASARDSYQQGAYGIRAQDYNGSAMATQAAGQYAQNGAQFAQMQQQKAGLEMQQRQLNDQNQQYYEGLGWNTNNAALNAGQGASAQAMQGDMARQQLAMQQQQANQQFWASVAAAGSTVAAGAITRRASGGPVDANKPVLVGEQGPEVIIPAGKGTVLPAHHPASITMAQAAQLRAQADALEAGMRRQLEAGPSARRLASGTPQSAYTTELTPGAEKAYEAWRQRTSPWDTGSDYDLRGAYADGIDRDARGHMPDTYKKPNHPTFSDESTYAQYGTPGHWVGETFVPAKPQLGNAAMRTINAAPVVISDGPDVPLNGQMSMQPQGPDMSVQPPERLWGGRQDPYTADPYYVQLDRAQPTMGGLLSGGRENPYQ